MFKIFKNKASFISQGARDAPGVARVGTDTVIHIRAY